MLAHPWRECEITLAAEHDYPSPCTDVDVWAEFTHDGGEVLRQPALWDSGWTWKIRFAAPDTARWSCFNSTADGGLAGQACEEQRTFRSHNHANE